MIWAYTNWYDEHNICILRTQSQYIIIWWWNTEQTRHANEMIFYQFSSLSCKASVSVLNKENLSLCLCLSFWYCRRPCPLYQDCILIIPYLWICICELMNAYPSNFIFSNFINRKQISISHETFFWIPSCTHLHLLHTFPYLK